MINWKKIGGVFAIVGVIIANFALLNMMIDDKVSAKLNSREFLKQVVEKFQPHFLIFDENKKILLKSKLVLQYIDPNEIVIEKKDRDIESIKIKTTEYIDFPPILTSLDENILFHAPERKDQFFIYKAVKGGGVFGTPYSEVPPPARFKLDLIIQ